MNGSPPHDINAEQALLGSVLIDQDALTVAALIVQPDDFYIERNRMIWETMLAIAERGDPPDYVSVSAELEHRRQLDNVGGGIYVAGLVNVVPTAAHVKTYAEIVERSAALRRLMGAAGLIAGLAGKAESDVDAVINSAEKAIAEIDQRRAVRGLTPAKPVVVTVLEALDRQREQHDPLIGLPTGFKTLDRLTSGLQRSNLIILAGRPSMGKSALAMDIALRAGVDARKVVGVFSLEMSNESLVQRGIANLAAVDGQSLRLGRVTEEEYDRILDASGRLSQAEIYFDDTPAISADELRRKARRLQMEKGLDLLVVDYLQLMRPENIRGRSREQEVASLSRDLKALARELNLPLMALSQLSRAVDNRPDKRPVLSDLRESGSLEQDSDVVMFLYRDDAYNKSERPNIAEVIVAKQRNGPTGSVELHFSRPFSRFSELEYYQDPEYGNL